MALVTLQQRLSPSVPASVALPQNFYRMGQRKMAILLDTNDQNFSEYANATYKLYRGNVSKVALKAAMLGRLQNNMIEGTHYQKPPGASLNTGKGIILLVAGKNQYLSAGVFDGDAWGQLHVGFRDWMHGNKMLILQAFQNIVPDQQWTNNRQLNTNQFHQNVGLIAPSQNNASQVARRGDQELLKALAHPDELNLKRNADGSIKSAGLPGGQARRIVLAAGGDPNIMQNIRRVEAKGTISQQLTEPQQVLEQAARSLASVANAMNPGGYSVNATRVRNQLIDTQAFLHRDANGQVRPAEEQRLISFNPAYWQSGGARRNGLELLAPSPKNAVPALAAPALPLPQAD